MRVISFSIIRDFIAKHADADVALRDWYKRTTKANWTNFADIKQTFNTVDYVGNDRYVFDIKGNNYRIVAVVIFINKKVYMRFVGTHEEYDKIKDIKNIYVMAQIKTEKQYKAACDRINELLKVVGNDTPADDKNMLELDLISDLVADYEEEHYPVAAPTLVETIKLRMYEMGLTQTKLAEMLGLSTARISEIITGKGEPSLKTGREISRKLNIDPAIVLGV